MFNAFLTTSLVLILFLDLLGVIVYIIVSGIVRARKHGSVRPGVSLPAPCPAGAPAYTAFSPAPTYFASATAAPESHRGGWGGLKRLRDRFSRKESSPARSDLGEMDAGHRKIGTILNSFKEDI